MQKGVVTGGKSGLQALCGKGSAKHAVNAAVMTACYSRPQSLAPLGRRWTKRLASVAAPKGAGRASPQSRGRAVDAPQGHGRHVAVARERGRLLDGHCAAARGHRAGSTIVSGVQRATGRGTRSRALTSERSDVVSRSGAAYATGVPNGWRDRCLDDTPRPPHATAREYALKGCYRKHCGIRTTCPAGSGLPITT